jgi:hypothetical protein
MFVQESVVGQNEEREAILCQARSDKPSKREIETLCLNLFSREFGYTLIGIKPISVDEVYGKHFQKINEACFVELKNIFAGCENFVLKISSRGQIHLVELINRKAVKELVRNNPVLKRFIKKEFKNEEEFYSEIEDSNRSIHKILKKDARIIGYLLGYSKTNIEYYTRRIDVGTYLQKYP